MKVIDILNRIANGEINEDTIIEFDNGYKDYCSVRVFFDRYIMDRENLNCEAEVIEDKPFNERVEEIYNRHIDYIYGKEDKKIEKVTNMNCIEAIDSNCYEKYSNKAIALDINTLRHQINKIIDYIDEEK